MHEMMGRWKLKSLNGDSRKECDQGSVDVMVQSLVTSRLNVWKKKGSREIFSIT